MIGRASVSAVVSMPETAVHKHGDLLLWKYEIWMSFYRVVSPPACNPVLLEYFNQPQFGGLVLFGLDPTHNVRSLFRIENISHGDSPGFKLYAEAGIGFRLQHDFVVSIDDAGERGVSLGLVKEAMLVDVRGQELLNVPYFDAPGQPSILCKIESGMYALENRDNNGVATGAEIGFTFFNQQRAGHSRTVNDRIANDKIAVAICGTVGHGGSVDFKRTFRQD